MKITDNFIFKVLTYEQAFKIWDSECVDMYILHGDDTESMIESREQLGSCIVRGMQIGLEVGSINPAQLFQDEAQRIADKFRTNIAEIVPKEDRVKIDELNAHYRGLNEDTCAAHEYCDANIPMSEAFTVITGREIELQNQPDVHLWNRAWEIAAVDGFANI